MCTTCGCSAGETRVAGRALAGPEEASPAGGGQAPPEAGEPVGRSAQRRMRYAAATADHQPAAHHHHHHDHGQPAAAAESRRLLVERDILADNNRYAAANRRRFDEHGIFALNLVSSPGSGKTTLLCRTIAALRDQLSIAVIEGDQQTSHDAERIRASGVAAVQINTGRGCHLDAHMVGHALDELAPADDSLLLIENVGNLVCPAAFDLGEAHKVVILSVTEGEDKPLKYSGMFHAASLMLLNKIDLLPHVDFDSERATAYARQVNPALQVMPLSATTGDGFEQWLAWLIAACRARRESRLARVASLRRRIGKLDAQLAAASGGT